MSHFLSQSGHDGDEVRWRLLFSGFYRVGSVQLAAGSVLVWVIQFIRRAAALVALTIQLLKLTGSGQT